MMQASDQISALGVTLYTESYTAIELVENIQLTALVVLIALVIIGRVVDGDLVDSVTAKAFGVLVIVVSVTLVITTFVRIWL